MNKTITTIIHVVCRYCNLYGSRCGWDARISKYEPNWSGLGENIAMTYESEAQNPIAAVVRTSYMYVYARRPNLTPSLATRLPRPP